MARALLEHVEPEPFGPWYGVGPDEALHSERIPARAMRPVSRAALAAALDAFVGGPLALMTPRSVRQRAPQRKAPAGQIRNRHTARRG